MMEFFCKTVKTDIVTGANISPISPNNFRPTNIAINETSGLTPTFLPIILGSKKYRNNEYKAYNITSPINSIVLPFISAKIDHGNNISPVPKMGKISITAMIIDIATELLTPKSFKPTVITQKVKSKIIK